MYAFGVARHSPDTVISWIAKQEKIETSEIAVFPIGKTLRKRINRKVLVMLNVSDAHRNMQTLNAMYKEKKVVIFGSPIRLVELDGITPLDWFPLKNMTGFRYTNLMVSKYLSAKDTKLQKSKEYVIELIDSLKEGSLLTPLMTFIYTLPASQQLQVKQAATAYICKQSESKNVLSSLNLPKKSKDRLNEILNSDISKKYITFFSETPKKMDLSINPEDYGCAKYEVSYLSSIIKQMEK
jgi:hypothetical protein